MKDPFKKVHLCSFGHFGGNGEKIPQWVKANGGEYSKNVSQGVTHLVTTMEALKKNVEAVRKAKRFKVKIVSYDWLKDSLLSKSRAPKREGPYLLETILKNEKKVNAEAKAKKASKRPAKVKAKRTDTYLRLDLGPLRKALHQLTVTSTRTTRVLLTTRRLLARQSKQPARNTISNFLRESPRAVEEPIVSATGSGAAGRDEDTESQAESQTLASDQLLESHDDNA